MASSTDKAARLEIQGQVAIITLNRPEKLNAVNAQLRWDLRAALDSVAVNQDVRVIILTGEGRGFCAGADVSVMRDRLDGHVVEPTQQQIQSEQVPLPIAIRSQPQPVIAAVNGIAVGMGLSMALASDIRIASEEARFASIFIKRSIVPDNGATYTLPRQVAPGIAAEMTLTGRIYDAKWASEKGLVNKVVPADKLMEEALALANEIAANAPLGVRVTKQLLYKNDEFQEQITRESAGNAYLSTTEDRAEAVRAFMEKRQPSFKGK